MPADWKRAREVKAKRRQLDADPFVISASEIQREFGISRRTLGRLVEDGALKPSYVRGRPMYTRSEIVEYLATNTKARRAS